MTKQDLRVQLRTKRRQYIAEIGSDIAQGFAEAMARSVLPLLDQSRIIAGYVPSRYEVDPLPALRLAAEHGRITALPYFAEQGATMQFVRWHPSEPLVAGPFGIPQPAHGSEALTPDFIITPLVGFDDRLARLGQGGGHYDRCFEQSPESFRLGFAWSVQQTDHIDVEPWDVPMHAIITEDHLWTLDQTT